MLLCCFNNTSYQNKQHIYLSCFDNYIYDERIQPFLLIFYIYVYIFGIRLDRNQCWRTDEKQVRVSTNIAAKLRHNNKRWHKQ